MLHAYFLCVLGWMAGADGPSLDQARQFTQVGKYEEALEAYDALEKARKPDDAEAGLKIALGKARVLTATGKLDAAAELLKKDAEAEKPSADALARLAELEFGRGQWEAAESHARKAIAIDKDHLLGRWIAARLRQAQGAAAPNDFRWFIEHMNARRDVLSKDADALVIIGQAAEQYYWIAARGDQLAEGLNDVLNDLYEAAITVDPKCWQSAWLQGRLFLNGFREAAAHKELNRALLINPSAAEVIVDLGRLDLSGYKLADGRRRAQDALEINPGCVAAHVLKADCDISDERFGDALDAARKAVALNPRDEDALARLAAASRLLVDPVGAAAAEAQARAVNPTPATFHAALGERLSDRRKYHSAEFAYLQALAADAQHVPSMIGLGMLYMQVGREREARGLFEEALKAWPFQDNVRTVNMLKVLDHLAGYTAINSDNFVVSVLPDQDQMLGKYMSRFLESIHADTTKRFGFAPPGKTQIEILKDHQWFSGRTTGQSFIPTVGACTGKVIAMASPRATRKPFNWSRVLVHEYTHVVTLQQTDFNIPHWFTEALAVESENTPRPQPWNKMLLERVPSRKGVLNLDNINLGFIRPEQPEDRQMAYCQAQLYAQYMVKRFGEDAIPKMLAAYRRGLTTEKAVNAALGVEKADFEKGFLDYLDGVLKTIKARTESEEAMTFSQIQRALAAKPDDADLNARMAYEHFARRDYKPARPFADKALKLQEHHPLASYVKARLFLAIGDEATALDILEPAFDPKAPNERVVDLLAELKMNAGKLDEAEKLYELAHEGDPYLSKWLAGLARVHLRQGRRDVLLDDLARLAANDADDLDVRQTLATEHLARKDYEQAARWATECLYIQVYDPTYHVLLGDANAGLKRWDSAGEEFRAALELKPKKPDPIKVKLARVLVEAGQANEARVLVEAVLKDDPENAEAKELKASLEKPEK